MSFPEITPDAYPGYRKATAVYSGYRDYVFEVGRSKSLLQ